MNINEPNIIVKLLEPKYEHDCARIMNSAMHQAFHWAEIDDINLESFRAYTDSELVYVALSSNHVAGFAGVYVPDKFLHHLYIDPSFQRMGIGSILLNKIFSDIGDKVSLKCQVKNKQAREFYRANAWVEESQIGGTDEIGEWLWIRSYSPKDYDLQS